MDEKDPRVSRERMAGRSDEYVAGRETPIGIEGPTAPRTGRSTTAAEPRAGQSAYPGSVSRQERPERTREIRDEIEQTREEMAETVNAIQERLRPGTIASNAAESVRASAAEAARDIAESEPVQYVRANPIPAIMVGVGIAGVTWLAFGGRDAESYRRGRYRRGSRDWPVGGPIYEGRGDYASASSYSPGMAYGETSESGLASQPSGFADQARHRAEQATWRVRRSASGAQRRVERAWRQNPLLVGAAAALIGAVIGMAVPETEREDELMGETRDNLLEGAQQAVRDKVNEVQNAASDAVSNVQNVASRAVGLGADEGERKS